MALRSFLTANAKDGGLFQSDEWARLQAASGHEAHPLQGIGFEGHVFMYTLPVIGRYLFLPRGPIIDAAAFASEEFRRQLIGLAEMTQAAWLRVEPQTEEALGLLRAAFGLSRVVAAPRDMNPRETFMASLDGGPGDWLERMKPKTRYNIRLAEKHGVTVRFSRSDEDIEGFLDLIYATTSRKSIAPHPKEYYRNFFRVFPEGECVLALAEHDRQTIAGALLVFFEGTAYYLHGGSADAKRELMAPFLLHLRSMEEAKRRGCRRYDFGGVRVRSKQSASDAGWDGITRFKQGFAAGTETLLFPGTYDIILSPFRYALYLKARRFSEWRRKLRTLSSRIISL